MPGKEGLNQGVKVVKIVVVGVANIIFLIYNSSQPHYEISLLLSSFCG